MNVLETTISRIEHIDAALTSKTQQRLDRLTKPQGSLGRLEDLAKQVVGITGKENPEFQHKVIFTLASDHGVAEERVSAYPREVTAQMVYNFLRGGAGINVLAKHAGARVIVVDMGVAEKVKSKKAKVKSEEGKGRSIFYDRKINFGTKNFAKGPAMTREEAVKSLETGIALVEEEFKNGMDIVGLGEMGIANTTASSAITAVFTGKPVKDVTGRGTGIDEAGLQHKIAVIESALAKNQPDARDAVDVLAKVGGFEIGGLSGIILAGAARRIPVIIDGFISGAAALIAYHLKPAVKEYMIAGHCSVERGHTIILEQLGLSPLLNLQMRLGEGTGAALAMTIVEASAKILTQMATFQDAGVSEKRVV